MAVSLREQAAVLALVEASPREWFRTAAVIADNGSAVRLLEGELAPMDVKQRDYAEQLVAGVRPGSVERAQALIERVLAQGVELITVLDEHYPLNLQLVYNRPPFIWVRGRLESASMRAIAVVGTRQASTEGRATAARLARELSGVGVTVISGLARGIDTAAHTAALDSGGRTVAVIGTGILAPTYPAENADLAGRISEHGAVVSQFWPDAPPRRTNFPLRNVVMSGLAAGTVVVEASATSGAKMQARLALEHGKQLFLHEQLLKDQDWAKRYAQKPGVKVVRTFDDVLSSLATLVDVPQQLPLAL
ncbi:MAG TPA: DNA-processing protein DprA [Streptosporangiaceae bacterium]|nr:DNA-processing protein DprA [Streptosporangiaceae bacterium]